MERCLTAMDLQIQPLGVARQEKDEAKFFRRLARRQAGSEDFPGWQFGIVNVLCFGVIFHGLQSFGHGFHLQKEAQVVRAAGFGVSPTS